MKKHLSSLALAALCVAAFAGIANAQANLGQNFSGMQPLRFTRSAPTVAPSSMVYQDSITVLAMADSIRTSNINTDGWDWATMSGNAASTAPKSIARVVFWVPLNYGQCCGADSLYYVIEPSFDGGQTYVSNGCNPSLGLISGFPNPVLGNYALQTTGVFPGAGIYAAGAHNGQYYQGMLVVDNDTAVTTSIGSYNVWGVRDFRLKIFGDATGVPLGVIKGAVYPITTRAIR
jgi:hypothetical protein